VESTNVKFFCCGDERIGSLLGGFKGFGAATGWS
jgi:hypothetical protein